MTFENWLAYLQSRFGSSVDENRDFLMNLWSADSVARDLTVAEQERDFAKAELHKQLGDTIDSLRSSILSIDATKVEEQKSDIVGEYYELKQLLKQKEEAQRVIQVLIEMFPSLCKEFPPPTKHIEKLVYEYQGTIQNAFKERKEEIKYRSSLEQIAKQAQKYHLPYQAFTPPYNKEEVDEYQSKMRIQLEIQQKREAFWEDLTNRAHNIGFRLEGVSIPYDRDELLARETLVVQEEEEHRDIQAITNKAKKLDYDISEQNVTMLFVRKRLWQQLNERATLWQKFARLEREYTLMGWKRIFSTEEKTEENLDKYQAQLPVQRSLLQDWRKKTSQQQREQVSISFPLSKDTIQTHLEKLSFDAKWRVKIDDIFRDAPQRPPALPVLITESFITDHISTIRMQQAEIEAWRTREATKKSVYGFFQKIWDFIALALFRKPKELFDEGRYFYFALYVTVLPTISLNLLGTLFFSFTTHNTLGENFYLSMYTLSSSWLLMISYVEYLVWGMVELAMMTWAVPVLLFLGFLLWFLSDKDSELKPLTKLGHSVFFAALCTGIFLVAGTFIVFFFGGVLRIVGILPYEVARENFPVHEESRDLPSIPCMMDRNTFEKRDACLDKRWKLWDDVHAYKDYLDSINDPSKTKKPTP